MTDRARRILYVNHTGTVSGGERSLLTLLDTLPEGVAAAVACPDGELSGELAQRGVRRFPLRGTSASLRLHPVHTPRAVAGLAYDGVAVRRAARRLRADLVHANSIRAGLIAAAARALGGPPVVVHVRDTLPPSPAARATVRLIRAGADVLVANSGYTRDWTARLGGGSDIAVVHSPVDARRFDPRAVSREEARQALGIAPGAFVAGIVGQVSPWKGHDVALRAFAALDGDGEPPLLLVAGSTKFVAANTRLDNRAFLRSLHEQVEALGLGDRVRFLGERGDVPAVLRALDVLLMPSVQEPFGRSAVEAMAMEVPVLATATGGPAEVIRDGVEGLLLPPAAVERWSEALRRVHADPAARERMGKAGGERYRASFTADRQLADMLAIYDGLR